MTMTAEMPTTTNPTATPRTARRKALPHADVSEMTDASVWVCQKSGAEFGAFALMMTGPADNGRCHLWHPVSRRNTYPRISTVSEHWRKATAEEEAAFRHQYGTAPLGLPAGTDMEVCESEAREEEQDKPKRPRPKLPRDVLDRIYSAMDVYPDFMSAKRAVLANGGVRRVKSDIAARVAERERVQAQVAEWNEKYPPGTRVALRVLIDGPEVEVTRTRSRAWVLCGTASVLVEGRAGGYGLEWLRPLSDEEDG